VPIPDELRKLYGLKPGDDVDILPDGASMRMVRAERAATSGQVLVEKMRGRATTRLSTDQIMALLRSE
jgi:bifunctional DNA-binding transcriptional regulator/antitoxin component of YhaV-PrlF toxin-antitoxin module